VASQPVGWLAIVAIRQSTDQQVAENRESTNRQDALVKPAIELGWHRDRRKMNRRAFRAKTTFYDF
jgi:hypothetical protein